MERMIINTIFTIILLFLSMLINTSIYANCIRITGLPSLLRFLSFLFVLFLSALYTLKSYIIACGNSRAVLPGQGLVHVNNNHFARCQDIWSVARISGTPGPPGTCFFVDIHGKYRKKKAYSAARRRRTSIRNKYPAYSKPMPHRLDHRKGEFEGKFGLPLEVLLGFGSSLYRCLENLHLGFPGRALEYSGFPQP